MLPQELIRKKRDSLSLSAEELRAFFYGFLAGQVTDYQMSAMLMAITIRGMSDDETSCLTQLMRDSGTVIEWTEPKELLIDKHSTGGIGDKTSIVLLPLAILEGLKVPMMAGRGLGHTGGTLDKLEAVGWNVYPSVEKARRQVRDLGGIIMGQTDEVAPLDKRLYAMRDVTATVESVPLIVGSILSKKLAAGVGGLVMDVKFGSGAFMREFAEAQRLAQQLCKVGKACGLRMRSLLTSMDSPLGSYAGNALEIFECIELMQGGGPQDTRTLVLELGSEMVHLAFPEQSMDDIRIRLARHLDNGAALEVFRRIASAQGGNLALIDSPEGLLRARLRTPVMNPSGGRFVTAVDVRRLGLAVLELGGGRKHVTEPIDLWVGLSNLKRVGAELAPDEPVAVVHANDSVRAERAVVLVRQAYVTSDSPADDPLIRERL